MDANYWDKVYRSKGEQEVSWFQAIPKKSLELIAGLGLGREDGILDVGGGDSRLVDELLGQGFSNLSVLDISHAALERAKARLGKAGEGVEFIPSDIMKFATPRKYRLWHDRATFHFLTKPEQVVNYLEIANQSIAEDGFLIVSTFSKTGPEKCSGLPISQYSDTDLKALFAKYFTNIRCVEDEHITPWKSVQNFVYCGFKKSS